MTHRLKKTPYQNDTILELHRSLVREIGYLVGNNLENSRKFDFECQILTFFEKIILAKNNRITILTIF